VLHHRAELIAHWQRTIGNQAVRRILRTPAEELGAGLTGTTSTHVGHDFRRIPACPSAGGAIQTKLAINTPGDEYEREADRVADAVTRTPEPGVATAAAPAQVQRVCAECEEGMESQGAARRLCHDREEDMQAKEEPGQTPSVPGGFERRFATLQGGGQPLPTAERAYFEPRFGRDFAGVRLHSGPAAGELARSVHARAFTLGDSIVFGPGQYAPGTSVGRRLIAHELTHVVQQGGGSTPDTVQRQSSDDTAVFDPHTKDPKRGFRAEDLTRLTASGVQLTFAGDLSPLTKDAQKLLLDNIAATVRFALDPNDPARIAELQVLRDFLTQNPEEGPFFDKPAERIDFTDLYHGHVCVPKPTLDNKAELRKLGEAVTARESANEEGIQRVIGLAMPTTRGESEKVMAVVNRHRQLFLDALAPLLQALTSVPEAGVLYHTREHGQGRPLLGGTRLKDSHPVRRIFTPLSTHQPKFQLKESPHCVPLANFSFHVDRSGRITLLPDASSEMVRAFEILHDALVPMPTQTAAPPAGAARAPEDKRWSISAAAGGDVTPDAQRLALALGGRVSLKADELLVFNPMVGFNLLYLPSSSSDASHLLAATADVTARIQQPLSGFYFDVSAGGFAGFDIDPKRETATEFAGGLTGALGAGWRWEHLDVGAEARTLVPEADFGRTNVLDFGRAAWRFGESKKPKR
jgi:hypothetical protein